jgi:hypothetical protein
MGYRARRWTRGKRFFEPLFAQDREIRLWRVKTLYNSGKEESDCDGLGGALGNN